MRVNSQQSNLPWTCTMRTKPERNVCCVGFFLFCFSFLLLCTPSMGVLLSKEELLFPEYKPGFQVTKMKLNYGCLQGHHLWDNNVHTQNGLL